MNVAPAVCRCPSCGGALAIVCPRRCPDAHHGVTAQPWHPRSAWEPLGAVRQRKNGATRAAILGALAAHPRGLLARDIVACTGAPPGKVHQMLLYMARQGVVTTSNDGRRKTVYALPSPRR